jgi:hypothetical protein
VKPEGPEAYRRIKELRVVVNHRLNAIWEDSVAPRVHACLDEIGVLWTSTDVVRIGVIGETSQVVLWIGVKPKCLAGEDAHAAAYR